MLNRIVELFFNLQRLALSVFYFEDEYQIIEILLTYLTSDHPYILK